MMKGQLAGLMRQAQQMQENMKKAQEALADIEVEGVSGGGLVKVTMNCRHDVKRVAIDPSLLGDDKDMLEDLIAAAINDELRKAEATSQEKMASVTAGCRRPGHEAAVLNPAPHSHPQAWPAMDPCPSASRLVSADPRRCGACPAWACVPRGAWPITCCSMIRKARTCWGRR